MAEVYIIAHQHWDPAWAFQRKHTVLQLPKLFEEVLERLERYPSYKFVLDGQTHIIKKYLEQLPSKVAEAKKEEISKYVKEGRLMVGPVYAQIDWNLTCGETWIRDMLIGHKDAEDLGKVMKVGWLVDIFGFPDATPRVLKGFNIDSIFLSRGIGVRKEEVKDILAWRSSDGTKALCCYLIESYRNAIRLAKYPEVAGDRIKGELKALLPYSSTGKTIILFDGYENLPEADNVIPIIEELDRKGRVGKLILCTPEEYLEAIKQRKPHLTKMSGYLSHGKYAVALRGVFSSRINLKQKYMKCERALVNLLDPLTCMLWSLGDNYPEEIIDKLWRRLLEVAFHDEICGCHIDDVYKDSMSSLGQIEEECEEAIKAHLERIAQNIDTSWIKEGIGLVVFNPSPWVREGIVRAIIEVPEELKEFDLRDKKGKSLPLQIGRRKRRNVEIWFHARIPPLGYKVYNILPGSSRTIKTGLKASERMAENEFLRMRINDDGTLTIWDKNSGYVYEKLAYLKSEGEAGDLYTSYRLDKDIHTSLGKNARITLTESGPLAVRFKIKHKLALPEGLSKDRKSRSQKVVDYPVNTYVNLVADSPLINFRTELNNAVKDHRLRVCFPTNIESDKVLCSEQFDLAEFPIVPDTTNYSTKVESPLKGVLPPQWDIRPADGNVYHGFIDISDKRKGLCLVGKDTYEYWVEPEANTIELTLLRGVGWLGVDTPIRAGRAGWGIRAPEAQCLGRHSYQYSILPHLGEWVDSKLHIWTKNYLLDPMVIQTNAHPGSLPEEFSFMKLRSRPEGALGIEAIKRSEDGRSLVIRICNYLDKEAEGEIRLYYRFPKPTGVRHVKPRKVYLCDLEERTKELPVDNEAIYFKARGKEIVTLRIEFPKERILKSHEGNYAKFIPQTLPLESEDEEWLRVKLPPIITKKEIKEDEVRIKEASERLEKARKKFEDLKEKKLNLSPKLEDRLAFWQAKLEMIKQIEEKKDADFTLLLDKKLYIQLTEAKEAIEERLSELQAKIDEFVNGLMDLRAESQVAHHVINCYELLRHDC